MSFGVNAYLTLDDFIRTGLKNNTKDEVKSAFVNYIDLIFSLEVNEN